MRGFLRAWVAEVTVGFAGSLLGVLLGSLGLGVVRGGWCRCRVRVGVRDCEGDWLACISIYIIPLEMKLMYTLVQSHRHQSIFWLHIHIHDYPLYL